MIQLILALSAINFSPITAGMVEEVTLDKFAQSWANSIESNDANKLLAFYEENEQLEVRMSSGMKLTGFKALKQGYQQDFDSVTFSSSNAEKVSIREFDKVAVISFEHRFEFAAPDNTKWKGRVQTVMVVQKDGEQWRIVNEHSSPLQDVPRLEQMD